MIRIAAFFRINDTISYGFAQNYDVFVHVFQGELEMQVTDNKLVIVRYYSKKGGEKEK
jgi:hypothetical protein